MRRIQRKVIVNDMEMYSVIRIGDSLYPTDIYQTPLVDLMDDDLYKPEVYNIEFGIGNENDSYVSVNGYKVIEGDIEEIRRITVQELIQRFENR